MLLSTPHAQTQILKQTNNMQKKMDIPVEGDSELAFPLALVPSSGPSTGSLDDALLPTTHTGEHGSC